MERDFIQETINSLKYSADNISIFYLKFKNGKISINEFEQEYKNLIYNVLNLESEIHYPNNGCPYVFLNSENLINDGSKTN